QAPEYLQAWHRDIAAERIGDKINLMPERGQRPDAMEFAERRPPRLEKRLRGDHQNAHSRVIFAWNRSTVRLPVSAEMYTEVPASTSNTLNPWRRYALV